MNGLGLANPAGAFAFAAVAILVALYLFDRRRRTIPVGSLFLWQRIAARRIERQRVRADLLFVLQLLLLLALATGYLRPYVEQGGGSFEGASLVLVLDVSASMQAREVDGTRFDLVRQRARVLVKRLAADEEAMLVTAGARARVVLPWTADHARMQDRLETLEPLDTPTDLAPAVELALGAAAGRTGASVAVFTDLPPTESGLAPEELARVDYVQVGRTDDNLAIAGLTIEQPPFATASEATATVVIRNYGHLAHPVALEARVGDRFWARRELALEPHGSEQVPLDGPPAAGEVIVTLETGDALAVDDTAVSYIAPTPPLDLLLVTDSRELSAGLSEVAAAIPGARLEVMAPGRYELAPPARPRLTLFDRVVPRDVPTTTNALYVAPPPGNSLCSSYRTIEAASVVDWEADHPALRGLGPLEALEVTHARALAPPDWGAPIVTAAAATVAFPLLVVGEHDGRRVACLATDLAPPLASSDHLPLLLLTLGTLRWLGEAEDTVFDVPTGLPVHLRAPLRAPVHGPAGGIGLMIAGDPPVVLADRRGTYRVGPPDAERVLLVNLFDDRESDIGRDGGGEWPASATARPAGPRPRRDVGWWLYLGALLLLGGEWLAWRRRVGG
jgi:hypothetical protein